MSKKWGCGTWILIILFLYILFTIPKKIYLIAGIGIILFMVIKKHNYINKDEYVDTSKESISFTKIPNLIKSDNNPLLENKTKNYESTNKTISLKEDELNRLKLENKKLIIRNNELQKSLQSFFGVSNTNQYLIINKEAEKLAHKEIIKIMNYDGFQFEQYLGRLLVKLDFTDVNITQKSGDQGIDVIGELNGIHYGFQCKHYQKKVGNRAVQEAYEELIKKSKREEALNKFIIKGL